MNIVVGVDLGRHYESVLNLANRLQFNHPHWILAHSIDVAMAFSGYSIISEAPLAYDFYTAASEGGQKVLDDGKKTCESMGLDVETRLLTGSAVNELIKLAEDTSSDLICVHSERKGSLGSLFLGSVSRGIAISAPQSILISKGSIKTEGPVTAVFATDHSAYADKAIERFLEMKPAGIHNIHVISALHISSQNPGDLETGAAHALYEEAQTKTQSVVSRFTSAGYCATGQVINRPVNEAISEAMESVKADLLILGGQGHGFVHRALLGSTTLHQVVAEPHSILIIRPKMQD